MKNSAQISLEKTMSFWPVFDKEVGVGTKNPYVLGSGIQEIPSTTTPLLNPDAAMIKAGWEEHYN